MFRQLLVLLLYAFVFHHVGNCAPSTPSNPDQGEPGEATVPPTSLPLTSSCDGCRYNGSANGSLPSTFSSTVTATPSKANSSASESIPPPSPSASSIGSSPQTVHTSHINTSAKHLSSPATAQANMSISTTLPTQPHTVTMATPSRTLNSSLAGRTTKPTTTIVTTAHIPNIASHSSVQNVSSKPTSTVTTFTAIPTAFTRQSTSEGSVHTRNVNTLTSELPVKTTVIQSSTVKRLSHHHSIRADATTFTHKTMPTTNLHTVPLVTSGGTRTGQPSINTSGTWLATSPACQNGSCTPNSSKSSGLRIVIPIVSTVVGLIVVGIVVCYVVKVKRLRLRRLQLVPLYAFEQEEGDDELLAEQSDEDDDDDESNSIDHRQVTLTTHHGMPQLVFDT